MALTKVQPELLNVTATSFTPTFSGMGTVSLLSAWYVQIGKHVHIYGSVKSGTVAAATWYMDVSGTFTIDSTKYPNTATVALGTITQVRNAAGPTAMTPWQCFYDGSDTGKIFLTFETGSNVYTKVLGNASIGTNDTLSFDAWVIVT